MIDPATCTEEEWQAKFATYSPFIKIDENGYVVESGTMQVGNIENLIEAGQPYLMLQGRSGKDRVVAGVVEPIPEAPGALVGSDLTGLHNPSTVTLLSPGMSLETATITDGDVELEMIEPGNWTIKIEAPGYLTKTIIHEVS